MKMKPLVFLSFNALMLGTFIGSASASPMVKIGDSVDIFVNSGVSARSLSNVYRTENNTKSDFLTVFSPGLEIRYGSGASAVADLTATIRYDILRYNSESDLNTENLSLGLRTNFMGARVSGSAHISYEEFQSPSGQPGFANLVEYDRFTAGIDGEFRYSPKISIGSGVRYMDQSYKRQFSDRFSDREEVAVPLNIFYELTPRLDLSVGYRFRYTDVDDRTGIINPLGPFPFVMGVFPGYSSNSHFFNVGVRGEVLPKVSGSARIGYARTNPGGGRDSRETLGLDVNLTWVPNPKWNNSIGISRDFGVSGEGNVTEDTRLRFRSTYELSPLLSVTGNLGYGRREFKDGIGRNDNIYSAGLRTGYRINDYWTISGGYTYEELDSNRNLTSYKNHIFDVSVGLRY